MRKSISLRLIKIAALSWFAVSHLSACGKVASVGVEVSGSVAVPGTLTLTISPASFVPFFTNQCQTLTSGQNCYSADPSVCAACLSQLLYNDLGLPQPSPSPSPSH